MKRNQTFFWISNRKGSAFLYFCIARFQNRTGLSYAWESEDWGGNPKSLMVKDGWESLLIHLKDCSRILISWLLLMMGSCHDERREKRRVTMEEKEVGIHKCGVNVGIWGKWVSKKPIEKIKRWKIMRREFLHWKCILRLKIHPTARMNWSQKL